MIGLPLRLLAREVYNKCVERVGAEQVALVTGEEKIKPHESALLGLDHRGDAARSRCGVRGDRRNPARRRSRARPRLHRPHAQPARPRGNAGARRRHHARHGREAASRREHPVAPAALDLAFRRREEAHAPAAPLRHRRVLGRRGVRDRRTDPPPARRRRGRARLALAAHPQRAGRALPVGRCRLSGRDRRDRHGAQSRCRSRGVRLGPQVRRLSVPQAQPGRTRPDRRPRRPRDARRHLRHHRALPAVRARIWRRRWRATPSIP